MLIIRRDQIVSLDSAAEKRYCQRLQHHLRAEFARSGTGLGHEVILNRILQSVRQARACGLRTGLGVLAYVRLALAAGPAFNTDPQIREFLVGGNPDDRIHRLFRRTAESQHTSPEGRASGSSETRV